MVLPVELARPQLLRPTSGVLCVVTVNPLPLTSMKRRRDDHGDDVFDGSCRSRLEGGCRGEVVPRPLRPDERGVSPDEAGGGGGRGALRRGGGIREWATLLLLLSWLF